MSIHTTLVRTGIVQFWYVLGNFATCDKQFWYVLELDNSGAYQNGGHKVQDDRFTRKSVALVNTVLASRASGCLFRHRNSSGHVKKIIFALFYYVLCMFYIDYDLGGRKKL